MALNGWTVANGVGLGGGGSGGMGGDDSLSSDDSVSQLEEGTFLGIIKSEKVVSARKRILEVQCVAGRPLSLGSGTSLGLSAFSGKSKDNDKGKGKGNTVRVVLDGERFPTTNLPWFTIYGARRLLEPGVTIRVVEETPSNQHFAKAGASDTEGAISAHEIELAGALPATPYLVRLLSMPDVAITALFGRRRQRYKNATPSMDFETGIVKLATALR